MREMNEDLRKGKATKSTHNGPGDFIRHQQSRTQMFPGAFCPHFHSNTHRHPALALVFIHEVFVRGRRAMAIER